MRKRVPADGGGEWLETDGLGGFAFGPVVGPRTRRYHALLVTATHPPTGRMVLVNGLELNAETSGGTFRLSVDRFHPDVQDPPRATLVEFDPDPWPRWTYRLDDGTELEQDIVMTHGRSETVVSFRRIRGSGPIRLRVRPFLSGRDHHALHQENDVFRFEPAFGPKGLLWRLYPGVPALCVRASGAYQHDPHWYRGFSYAEEQARGLDYVEALATPGVFDLDLDGREGVLVFRAGEGGDDAEPERLETYIDRVRSAERSRRARLISRLDRAADAYIVARGRGRTIIAGYPWFTDWGRDTFIALRGLCIETGRLDVARDILVSWAGVVSQGMLPNVFPDGGAPPEYNSVDASLWFVIAVHAYLEASRGVDADTARALMRAVDAILAGYSLGTRYGIRKTDDGLLAAGVPGVQLTWMDAKVGDKVVTPRMGKPVEVQALWLNALRIAAAWSPERAADFDRGAVSFAERFWSPELGCLYDGVDVDHVPGKLDRSLRPNQILAVGGLPYPLVSGPRARAVVDLVERMLLTPLGLRSLAPGEPGYRGRYEGDAWSRDTAYHQGTVWPWLMGPFVDAWIAVRGGSVDARREAERRFVAPLLAHLDVAGIGHVSEIADGDPPHMPRGCPFQAWSVGELIRAARACRVAPQERALSARG